MGEIFVRIKRHESSKLKRVSSFMFQTLRIFSSDLGRKEAEKLQSD